MKRYEKMSKEEIISWFSGYCETCPLHDNFCVAGISCGKTMGRWLTQEIETKPRFKTLDTKEKLLKAQEEYQNYCSSVGCTECRYYKLGTKCFTEFLLEEVEV